MKINKASYLDDGITVSGVLVKRFLHKPVFYPSDPSCGWHSQVITEENWNKIVVWVGEPRIGKVSCHGGKREEEKEK